MQAHRRTPGVRFEDSAQIGEELGRAPSGRQAQVQRQVRTVRQVEKGHRLPVDRHALLAHIHLAFDLDDDVLGEVRLDGLVRAREEEHVHRARQVLNGGDRPGVSLLGHLRGHSRHEAGNLHDSVRHGPFRAHDLRNLVVLVAGEGRLHAAQRVVGDVESQHFALGSQLRLAIKLGQVGDVDREACPRGRSLVQGAKEIELADRLVAFDVDDRIDSLIAASQQRPACVAH